MMGPYPDLAWDLMVITALCCHLLVGYGARGEKLTASLLVVLPLVVSISLLLIADIDATRGKLIRVRPHNLVSPRRLPP